MEHAIKLAASLFFQGNKTQGMLFTVNTVLKGYKQKKHL